MAGIWNNCLSLDAVLMSSETIADTVAAVEAAETVLPSYLYHLLGLVDHGCYHHPTPLLIKQTRLNDAPEASLFINPNDTIFLHLNAVTIDLPCLVTQ